MRRCATVTWTRPGRRSTTNTGTTMSSPGKSRPRRPPASRARRRFSIEEEGDAMNVRILILSVAMATTAGAVWAKLPPAPINAANEAEAKKKADDAAKKDADTLGRAQDRATANYRKNKGIRGLPATAKAAPRKLRPGTGPGPTKGASARPSHFARRVRVSRFNRQAGGTGARPRR